MAERPGLEYLFEHGMVREEVVSSSEKKEEFGVDLRSPSRKCSCEAV